MAPAAPPMSLGAASLNSGVEGEVELGEMGTPVVGDEVPEGVAGTLLL